MARPKKIDAAAAAAGQAGGREYIDERQAAEYISVAPRTMRDWRQKGQIDNKGARGPKYYICGKHILYEIHELDGWVREGCVEPAAPGGKRHE